MQQTKRHNWPLFVILIIGLGLRLVLLNGSFWLDEAAQALEIIRPLHEQFQIVEDFQPPLLHLLLHGAQYFSRSEWFLRLIGALVPGIVTLYATYQIGLQTANRRVATVATLLLATSTLHIFYSQELRPYALPAMIAALSWWRVLDWRSGHSSAFDAIFCLLTFLGLFTSYLYPFLVISQIAYVLLAVPSAKKKLAYTLSTAALGFLPWLPFFVAQLHQGKLVSALVPGWTQVVGIPQLKSLPLVAGKFVFGVIDLEPTLFIITAAFIFLGLLGYVARIKKYRVNSALYAYATWLVLPIILAWLISFGVPILQPKRVLFALPAFYLLIALLYDAAISKSQTSLRIAGTALVGVLLFIHLIGYFSYLSNPRLQRENWRALHHQITTQYSKENSVAVFAFPKPFAPWQWYDDGTFPTMSLGTLGRTNADNVTSMLNPLIDGRYQYVLVFDYLRDLTDPQNLIISHLNNLGFTERDTIDYPNIGFVRVFTRREAATAYDYRY